VARAACSGITGENANCVYDVMVTGNPGFATTYALGQSVQADLAPADDTTGETPSNLSRLLLALLIGILIGLLICLLKRRWSRAI